MIGKDRRRLRLWMRDAAALAAFLAVALSGSLPLPVTAIYLPVWLASVAGFRPLAGRPVWSTLLLLALAVVLFGAGLWGAIDLVVAAVSFATLVTAHRLLSDPTTQTDQQVLLASLLLVAGAAALTGEMWYAVCLLGFGIFACLTLGLTVLEGPDNAAEDVPVPVPFVIRQLSSGVALALVGGLVFFVLFPRLSWNVAARGSGPAAFGGTTGLADRIRLQAGGALKTSAQAVLRATLKPDPRTDVLDAYWVGRYFERFDGKEWTTAGQEQPPQREVTVGKWTPKAITQRIELLPAYGSRTVVALAAPLAFSQAVAMQTSSGNPTSLAVVPGEEVRLASAGNAYRYVATSNPQPGQPTPLDDEAKARLLALPPGMDPRVAELARREGGEGPPQQVAGRLERYLKAGFGYTLELPGQVSDPLSHFLFERKEGHCEHFATALAVLARARGIPARVVTGFYGGDRAGEGYVVRAGDAHAWVQIHDGQAWVSLDATPEAYRRNQTSGVLAWATQLYEQLDALWRRRVMDYSIMDQFDAVRLLVRPPEGREATLPQAGTLSRETLLGGGLALVLAWGAWMLLSRPRRSRHPASTFLERLERQLQRAGIAPEEDEDVEALAGRLTRQGHPLSGPVQRAVRRYLEARFGSAPLAPGEPEGLLAPIAGRPRRQGVAPLALALWLAGADAGVAAEPAPAEAPRSNAPLLFIVGGEVLIIVVGLNELRKLRKDKDQGKG